MINVQNGNVIYRFRRTSDPHSSRPQPVASWLRGLAFTLALCFLWSFTLAGVAMAAHERSPEPPKPHSLWMSPTQKARMQALAQKVKAMQAHAGKPGFPYRQAADQAAWQAIQHPQAAPHRSAPITLLDSVGLLARPVPAAQVASWYAEKKAGHVAPARAALLDLWMGEWELAHNQHPQVAQPLFRQARILSSSTSAVYGVASYDAAMALFYEGAYADATAAFRHLEARQSSLRGYDYNTCSLWLRHANACAAYHADRAAIGIPEPPRLDPLCGVAALAACLRSLGMPSDKQALLNASHVTGEGNNLNDIAAAARKLGAAAYPVSAEDKTVIALPKPLVAYVEHDHFVALVRADQKGVSYLCADCGPWPGGRVDLTWAQWRQMNPGLYLAVTKPGSGWDQRLAAAQTGKAAPPVRVAMVTPTNQPSPHLLLHLGSLALPKGVTVLNNKNGRWVVCGGRFYSPICVGYQCCLTQGGGGPGGGGPGGGGPGGGGPGGGGPGLGGPGLGGPGLGGSVGPGDTATAMGPTADDPVNLATGNEEYTPTDLKVYNPHGPSVTWGRIYDSLQPYDLTTGSAYGVPEQSDFGSGWSQTYNIGVQDSFGDTTNNKYVYAANGSRTAFVAPAVPTASTPSVLCNVQPGAPFVVYWNYDSATTHAYFQVVNSDRSQWTTTEQAVSQNNVGNTNIFLLAKQTDRNGNSISFNYTTTDTGFPLLSTITNQDGTVLLSVLRVADGTGNVAQIADCYGRSVFYHVEKSGSYGGGSEYAYALALDHVSQIVPSGASVLPDRYVYGYQVILNWEPSNSYYSGVHFPINYLHTITVPSPTGVGVSTATINYDPSYNGPLVTSLVDGNGNTTSFTSSDSSGNPVSGTNYTLVTFSAYGASTPSYAYVGGYDNSMNGTTKTDGAGNVLSTDTFSDPSNPFRPSSVTNGNNNTVHCVWDAFGNLHQVTSPRGTVTNYTWAFPSGQVPTVINSVAATNSGFLMGELVNAQQGTKTPLSYVYSEPSGLISSVSKPMPGTSGSGATVVYSFSYDNFGNITLMTMPGNNAASAISTTLAYGSTPSIGQPLSVTDTLGHSISFTYDAQGNKTSITDAGYTNSSGAVVANTTFYKDVNGNSGYNIANQLVSTFSPPTGQTGSGRTNMTMTYLYSGGPMIATKNYDESNQLAREVDTAYGPEGETTRIFGSTQTVSYVYDALYRLDKLTDGNNNTTKYFYNAQGYLYQTAYPGAGTATPTTPLAAGNKDTITCTGYDSIGNLLGVEDGNGTVTTFAYADPESSLTTIHYTSTSGVSPLADSAYAYDQYGRRSQMSDNVCGAHNSDGTITRNTDGSLPGPGVVYAYDDNDTPTSIATTYTGLPTKTISYTYYANNSRSGMTTPAGSFSYLFDGVGHLVSQTNPFGETTKWTYAANNWMTSQAMANGDTTSTTYNGLGEIMDQATKQGSTILAEFAVANVGGYDAVGNRLAVSQSGAGGGQTTFQYDNRNELISEVSTRSSGYSNTFSYDAAENPTVFRGKSLGTANSDNQMPGNSFDGNGSPTKYNGNSLAFDPQSRVTLFANLTCGYREDGVRAWKQNSNHKTYFLYDGEKAVCELDSSGAVTATNSISSKGLLSRHTASGSTFYDFDLSGNVAQRLASSGAATSNDTTDAFGNRNTSDVGGDPFGFAGQWGGYTDIETGLVLLTHRFYDTTVGRFLTRDPISYRGGINVYGYTQNNPANFADPSGLCCVPTNPTLEAFLIAAATIELALIAFIVLSAFPGLAPIVAAIIACATAMVISLIIAELKGALECKPPNIQVAVGAALAACAPRFFPIIFS